MKVHTLVILGFALGIGLSVLELTAIHAQSYRMDNDDDLPQVKTCENCGDPLPSSVFGKYEECLRCGDSE